VPVEGKPLVPQGAFHVYGAVDAANLDEVGGTRCTARLSVGKDEKIEGHTLQGECPEAHQARIAEVLAQGTALPLAVREARPWVGDVTFALTDDGRVFYEHAAVDVKRRVVPTYPAIAKYRYALGSEVDCKLRIRIDESGAPYEVKFESCPTDFQESAYEAIMKWRWYPVKIDGQPVKAQFLLNVKYKLDA
jgi:hypothetical protein